ncbi:MAG: VOC family protein [Bacillota bacterium]|jgi:catechol 2,3-dioxygenase|nr:VOC family protein [Bacillota bacterium]HHT91758.1 VOC family protein [Bacillota bacterium]
MAYHDQPATYVERIQLRIENLHRSLEFYQNILGFTILERTESEAKLSADGLRSIVSLVQPADIMPKVRRRAGLYHFALLLPERSDLASMVVHLVNQGLRFGSANHLVSEAIYFEDPDGNGIEIFVDTDPSTWTWTRDGVTMSSEPLDFDDLLQEAGAQAPFVHLPPATILGHIHLHVSELASAERFYTQGLGFDVVTRFRDNALFLSTQRYHHHIALNTWNGAGAPPTPRNSVGLDFFTLIYPSKEALVTAAANLQRLGAPVRMERGDVITTDPSEHEIHLTIQK